jgi:glycosyltransferase involved in cell wall biosynthesis
MKIVAISCVKNEEDIIEAFIRHTLYYVDQIIILDNDSNDNTKEILLCLKREGLPLDIIEDPSIGHWHEKRMNYLMREYALNRYSADGILPLDADEFIYAKDVERFTYTICSSKSPIKIAWRSYVPHVSDKYSVVNPVLRIRYRLKTEGKQTEKAMVPAKILSGNNNISLSQGNHNLLENGKKMRSLHMDGVYLGHFPVRSPGQYAAKIAVKYLQYMSMQKREVWGWHYKNPYELLKTDPETFFHTYREAALMFAVKPKKEFKAEPILDPIPYRGEDLRYSSALKDDRHYLTLILNYVEHLAKEYKVMKEKYEKMCKLSRRQKVIQFFRSLVPNKDG